MFVPVKLACILQLVKVLSVLDHSSVFNSSIHIGT